MKEYRIILPITTEACFHIVADSPERAADEAIRQYQDMPASQRISRTGAGFLLEASGDGEVIGTPSVELAK